MKEVSNEKKPIFPSGYRVDKYTYKNISLFSHVCCFTYLSYLHHRSSRLAVRCYIGARNLEMRRLLKIRKVKDEFSKLKFTNHLKNNVRIDRLYKISLKKCTWHFIGNRSWSMKTMANIKPLVWGWQGTHVGSWFARPMPCNIAEDGVQYFSQGVYLNCNVSL